MEVILLIGFIADRGSAVTEPEVLWQLWNDNKIHPRKTLAGSATCIFRSNSAINESRYSVDECENFSDNLTAWNYAHDIWFEEGRNGSLSSDGVGEEKPFDFLRSFYEGAIAGAAACVAAEAALYPIDTIKTRLQAVHGGGNIILKGLYSGLAGNVAGVFLASALYLGVYEPTKQKLLKDFPEKLSAFVHLTAGALGGAASSIIRVPVEVLKQRMQTGQFASSPEALRLIVSNEGFNGLYAGYGSFLLRDLPFDAVQFCIYEQLRIGYKLAAKRDLNDPENAILGAFAGAITGAVTTPLDVIKTRLMVQGSVKQYNGIFDCARTIMRDEGSHALFKGIGPRVLWLGLGGSIFFAVLEKTKQMLAERQPGKKKSLSIKQD